uniref:Uncharacterized protein n=1 Tax=Amphiprion ocellaris TaxID=80972 RepID=A0A3Q1BX14_AMPOC
MLFLLDEKAFHHPGLGVVHPEHRQRILILPAAFPHIIKVTQYFWALNPGALASSFIIKVRDGIHYQNKPISSILKTCSGVPPFWLASSAGA